MDPQEDTSPKRHRLLRRQAPRSLAYRCGRAIFAGQRTLWIASAVVAVPLALLLGFQFWLVRDLERSAAVAHSAALQARLDLLAKQVALHFSTLAERTLRIPPWVFERTVDAADRLVFRHLSPARPRPDSSAAQDKWLTASGQGVRQFFVVPLGGRLQGRILGYELPQRQRIEDKDIPSSTRLALSYWQKRAETMPESIDRKELITDERDPARPMLLSIVADEQSQPVGLTALVIDLDFFAREALPALLHRTLGSEGRPPEFAVCVWDGVGREVIAVPDPLASKLEVRGRLGSVLGTWTIALGSRVATGAESARASFLVNVTLSVLLAGLLLAAIVLVVHTAAREMRLSEIKSDFVSNVSHELRTPLSSIRVFGELMRLGRVNDADKVREYGDHIEVEGRRLSRLIDTILDFSRLESGTAVYQIEEHDIAAVVRDVLQTFAPRLERAGFVVDFVAPEVPLPPVRIDEAAIGRALGNLIDNALKYSGTSRRVSVSLAVQGTELIVAVKDRGIGIPREEHERIFDRFHRVGAGLVHDVRGSGLGLAIVKHIADAHGGKVTVESSPGNGSVFALCLPLAGVDASRGRG